MLTETTLITLADLRLYAYHGMTQQERKVGAWFNVTLRVDYPFEKAVETDCVEDTLSYDELVVLVRREMSVASNLLEHVAGRVLSAVFRDFPLVRWAEVEISKENPPMGENVGGARVTLSGKNED